VLVTLAGVASLALFAVNRHTSLPQGWGSAGGPREGVLSGLNALVFFLQSVVAVILAALIIGRQPRNRVGWLVLAAGVGGCLILLAEELVVFAAFTRGWDSPAVHFISWVKNWLWVPVQVILLLTLALFPSGHFLSRRWNLLIGLPLVALLGLTMSAMVIEDPMNSAFQLRNPYFAPASAAPAATMYAVGRPMMALALLAILAQVVARYRAGGFVERQQIKWPMIGLAAMSLTMTVGLIVDASTGGLVGAFMINCAGIFTMVGLGFGMLRYRLYDVDLIIRRTALYGLLTGALALIYFSSVIVMQNIAQRLTGQAGDSPLIIVISTLLIAALFTPLRRRLQVGIDRRFYRQHYDAQKTLAAFARTARDEVELGRLSGELLRIVQETMQPESVRLWLRGDEPERPR
jgi:hypothetical protein